MCSTITVAFAFVLYAIAPTPCCGDVFGPEKPITLPPISVEDLRSVESQIKDVLPQMTASCVRIESFGSGVIISPDGLVLTHCHLDRIFHGKPVQVHLSDGRKVDAKYLGGHRNFDLSLVRIEGADHLPSVSIESARNLSVGQPCLALSFPASFDEQISSEPLLRLSRILDVDPRCIYSEIPPRPGDSGGPMFNVAGKLVGICRGTDKNPISFYTRADLLNDIVDDLMSGEMIDETTFAMGVTPTSTGARASTTRNLIQLAPKMSDTNDSPIPAPLAGGWIGMSDGFTPEQMKALESSIDRFGASMVAIFDQSTKRQVGSGTIIDESGIVLTHGTGVIGPKRIGRNFDVMLRTGEMTTGKYVGVHRGYRLSVMQLAMGKSWPAATLGDRASLKSGTVCFMVSSDAKHGKEGFLARGTSTRALALTDNRIYTALTYGVGSAGAALVTLDGALVGVKGQTPEFARADLYRELKTDFLTRHFFPKYEFPRAFNNLDLSALPVDVKSGVVRILCDGRQVALGLVVTDDGNVVTKASALVPDCIQCEFGDGTVLDAQLLGRSYRYDIALLDVKATDLPVPRLAVAPPIKGTLLCSIRQDGVPINAGVVGSQMVSVPTDEGQLGFEIGAGPEAVNGVRVTNVLYSLTKTVLKVGDIITRFDGADVSNEQEFKAIQARLLEAARSFAGERVPATVLRNGVRLQLMIPIELGDERNRSRPVTDPIAPLLPDELQGRHNGFPAVFAHDAMARVPCDPVTIEAPNAIVRKDLGGPVVNLSGEVAGINIGSFKGTFAFAVPCHVVAEALEEIRQRGVSDVGT